MSSKEQSELISCCRRGDSARIYSLVHEQEVEINWRDAFDSTPLSVIYFCRQFLVNNSPSPHRYYACLCGHIECVQLLLESGARCDAQTFDGEVREIFPDPDFSFFISFYVQKTAMPLRSTDGRDSTAPTRSGSIDCNAIASRRFRSLPLVSHRIGSVFRL